MTTYGVIEIGQMKPLDDSEQLPKPILDNHQ